MTFEHKDFGLNKIELKEDGEARVFEGYGSIFNNEDSYGDIVMPGAFTRSLKSRTPKLLWQHRMDEPVGVFNEIREDATGLYVKGRILDTQRGMDAYKLLKGGAINGLSIGFITVKASYSDKKSNVRMLEDLELFEISLVTFPANESANVMRVKSLDGVGVDQLTEYKRNIEAALRDAGASDSVARYIASQIKSPAGCDAQGESLVELKTLIEKNLNILRS